MSSFEPIAIVGRGCVLPGALHPDELWELIVAKRDCVRAVPEGVWGCDRRGVHDAAGVDGTWTDRGGYVTGFEQVFDPSGLGLTAAQVRATSEGTRWLLHAGRQALDEAAKTPHSRTGIAIGNLSFPTREMTRFAETTWWPTDLGAVAGLNASPDTPASARHRYMSGLPAEQVASTFGLGGPVVAMDAACASALYAIGHACEVLQRRGADAMLAGAVNSADDLLVHIGFCALKALSKSGQSRPMHRGADGLVPASGAGLLLLKRLDDARRDGDRIWAVIRGVGLGNDGRGRGFLAPSVAGQRRAMQQAYDVSGLKPQQIGLIECHATGTQVGDKTEIESTAAVFAGCVDVPIGSLKSNLGHLVTAAGVAGMLKAIAALNHRTVPPSLHTDAPIDALTATPFTLVADARPWPEDRPLRAAVSAFGFGGNNAHVLIEAAELTPETAHSDRSAASARVSTPPQDAEDLVVVGVGCAVGEGEELADFAAHLREPPAPFRGRADHVRAPVAGLGVPPRDLQRALPQQLAIVRAALAALEHAPGAREHVVSATIGMGCDPAVSRHAARWRLPERAARLGITDRAWLDAAREGFVDALDPAALLGCMPNIPANRLNHHLGLDGPSLTVSAEERSGLAALDVARGLLRSGRAEVALVGAVDFSCEAVAQRAAALCADTGPSGDAAVVFVVTTPALAALRGWSVHAHLQSAVEPPPTSDSAWVDRLRGKFGKAHAAWGWVQVAAAIVENAGDPAKKRVIQITSVGGVQQSVTVAGGAAPLSLAKTVTNPKRAATIVIPAHAPAPVLPPLPPRALQLPQRAAPSSAVMRPKSSRAMSPPPTLISPLLHAAMQQLETTRSLHNHFVAVSTAAHQQFLRSRSTAALQLLAARRILQAPAEKPRKMLPGPAFSRAQLEVHSGGKISSIYGPDFAGQDDFARQVRMPQPPLLLADRVLGMDAAPRSMGRGTIWTETDVRADSWYLHDGRMPAGVMIEAGQADLMLISWLGIDFENQGERVYRLLGCDLTYSGGLLQPGDTIEYDIHCDGHARQGTIGLFFFHYDGRVRGQTRIAVRNGQAGFFTDADLANSKGILWRAEDAQPTPQGRVDPAFALTEKRAFTGAELTSLAAGDAQACFGTTHALGSTATRPPRIAGGRMLFLDEVTHFDPAGGPWERGYLRATDQIAPDDWFFNGHFHNDPCMPGTLMFEGCLQTMAIYLSALGFGLERDGWRFEPVPDTSYPLRCRGQVLPTSRELVYEVFVDEVIAGPTPTLWADILCTIDGLPAFWCRRMGLQLSPGWPLDDPTFTSPDDPRPWPQRIAQTVNAQQGPQAQQAQKSPQKGAIARIEPSLPLDYAAMMATAWGAPSAAFGPMYEAFDNGRRVARLPGPPYHFMSRVESIDQPPGQMKTGVTVDLAWDIPADGFFFAADGTTKMPFCVFLEAALQPCGWLASYVGCATTIDKTLFFRNLDGTGTWVREIGPHDGTLRTRATLTKLSKSGGMILVGFKVQCSLADEVVYTLDTGFGFFPAAALANQAGLPVAPRWQSLHDRPANVTIDVQNPAFAAFSQDPLLPAPTGSNPLWMLTEIDVVDPGSGDSEGQYRAQHEVDPTAWYFKAHFFQDPVQPGSLGLEAISQLLRFAMIDRGLAERFTRPRFAAATGRELVWSYRGQVLPTDRRVTITLELTAIDTETGRTRATADGCLWVDGRRIYEALGMTVELVEHEL